ncbi:MAG: hypothetical protein GY760_08605 [Deltaproteobacteria bacterium]|nr:hypothetical protein [Deltaproteobacteria bacterium]
MKKKYVTLSLGTDLIRQMEHFANEDHEGNLSQFTRKIIKKYIKENPLPKELDSGGSNE